MQGLCSWVALEFMKTFTFVCMYTQTHEHLALLGKLKTSFKVWASLWKGNWNALKPFDLHLGVALNCVNRKPQVVILILMYYFVLLFIVLFLLS